MNQILYRNIDQKLVNSLHGLGGLDCHDSTTGYKTRVHCIHSYFAMHWSL